MSDQQEHESAEAGYGPPIDLAQAERDGTWPYGEVTPTPPGPADGTDGIDAALSRIIQARIAAVWTVIVGENVIDPTVRAQMSEAAEQVTRECLRANVYAVLTGRSQALTGILDDPARLRGFAAGGAERLNAARRELHNAHDALAAAGMADSR